MKKFLFVCIVVGLLYSRENPFVFPQKSSSSLASLKVQQTSVPPQNRSVPNNNDLKMQQQESFAPEIALQEPIKKEVAQRQERKIKIHKQQETLPKQQQPLKEIYLPFITVQFFSDGFAIQAKDPIMRHFMTDKPKKIVIDFRSQRDFATRRYNIDAGKAKRLEIGAHAQFYRVAVSMRKCAHYRIKRDSGRTLFICEESR